MRVLLWDLPLWLEDILTDAIRADRRLELVDQPSLEREINTVLRDESVDVLVTHAESEVVARSSSLLFANPRLRMVSLGSGRGNTAHLSLSASEEQLGNLSLPELIGIIASDHLGTVSVVDLSARSG